MDPVFGVIAYNQRVGLSPKLLNITFWFRKRIWNTGFKKKIRRFDFAPKKCGKHKGDKENFLEYITKYSEFEPTGLWITKFQARIIKYHWGLELAK